MSRTMFEKLESVEWEKLHHCYGPASDIPQLLRDLLSADEDERGRAFRILHETLWHQGSVFEASAYAVPFLVAMLRSSAAPSPVQVAFLLAMLTQSTEDVKTVAASTEQWFLATREALKQDVDVLYPFLAFNDATVRQYMARTLVFYPERAEETLPLLNQILATEADEFTRPDIEAVIEILKAAS